MNFKIIIPSYKRERVVTWELLGENLRKIAWVVCSKEEAKNHKHEGRQYLVCPVQGRIHRVRQWIIDNVDADAVMVLDDDLRFFRRIEPSDWHLRNATHKDLTDMVRFTKSLLSRGYIHTVLTARPGNNRVEPEEVPYTYFQRPWMACSFLLPAVRRLETKFRTLLMSDFDFALQLLRLGYANPGLTEWCCGQSTSSNAPGGCSGFRTAKSMKEASELLQSLHPKYVKLVEKETDWGEIKSRIDVEVSWKQAWRHAPVKHGDHADPKFEQIAKQRRRLFLPDITMCQIRKDGVLLETKYDFNKWQASLEDKETIARWTEAR